MDPAAVRTLRRNRDFPVLDKDVHTVESSRILAAAGLSEGEATLLAGGPPCQPFSKMGYWKRGDTRRLDDPRSSTLEQYLRVLRDTKPTVFLLENVPGLGYRRKDEGLELLLKTIEDINEEAGTAYRAAVQVLNAAHFGVPQERKRLFVIGHREGLHFDFPAPTHGAPGDAEQLSLPLPREPVTTAWDALGDLEEDDDDPALRVTGKWAGLLPSIPEGGNYLYHTDRGDGLPLFGWRRRYWAFLLKLAKRLPAWTITAQPGSAIGPFHWKNRRLSTRELCRLQTFPDAYALEGGRTAVQMQLGNAVPSALAEALGLAIRSTLLGDEAASSLSPTLTPSRKRPIPDPEPTLPVPDEYAHLVGEHEAHPGTGLGYGARLRGE